MNCTNWNEESSLVGNADPMSANSHYVIEDLVINPFGKRSPLSPQMRNTPTSNRSGLRARLVSGSGIHLQNITERRQMFSSDTFPSPPSDEQRLLFQIETEAAEAEVRAERTAILRLQLETERAELDARKTAARRHLLLPSTGSASCLEERPHRHPHEVHTVLPAPPVYGALHHR